MDLQLLAFISHVALKRVSNFIMPKLWKEKRSQLAFKIRTIRETRIEGERTWFLWIWGVGPLVESLLRTNEAWAMPQSSVNQAGKAGL